jgi:hypothetical protein
VEYLLRQSRVSCQKFLQFLQVGSRYACIIFLYKNLTLKIVFPSLKTVDVDVQCFIWTPK